MTFTWRRTFPETTHDFAAEDDGEEVGRIRRHEHGTQKGRWMWSAYGIHCGRSEIAGPLQGDVATKVEAVQAITEAWGRAKAWSAETGKRLTSGASIRRDRSAEV